MPAPDAPPPSGAVSIQAAAPPPQGAVPIIDQGGDFVSHAGSSTWDNVKGAFNLATGADLWSHAIDSARAGNYGEAAKAFQGIVDGPAQRVADGLIDTAKVAAGHMKDAASKLVKGDTEGAAASANAAGLHAATVLAPHAEQAAENFKQGKYGAGFGDLTGDAAAFLAAKGIHAVPGAAEAAVDLARGAPSAMTDAVRALPTPNMTEGTVAVTGHPHLAAAMYAKRAIPEVWKAIREPATVPDAADPARPIGAPQPVTPNEMRTPLAPEASMPDAGNVYPRNYKPAPPAAPAAADPASKIRDGIAEGFGYTKGFASIKDANVAATVQRLADQQIARDAQAPPAAAQPPAPPPAGSVPVERATVAPVPIARDVIDQLPDARTAETDALARSAAPAPEAPAPAAPPTVLQNIDKGITAQRPTYSGLAYQDELRRNVDAEIARRKAQEAASAPPPSPSAPPSTPPPGEPGEAAAPAPTPPPPAAPAAPAAAEPPPYGKQYITPGRMSQYAADNGLSEDDAAAALQKQGVEITTRSGTNRYLHAIAGELGYNHENLTDISEAQFGKGKTLSKITHEQMSDLADTLTAEADKKRAAEAAQQAASPNPLPTKGQLTQAAQLTLKQQMQASLDALRAKNAAATPDASIPPEAEGSPLGGVVQQLPVSEIHADPVRFQYKSGMGQGGAGDELRSVTKFDPEKSGIVSVWKDPADGKTYVVNGHHRLELAQRTGAATMTVRYLDAANAAEARAKGAMINIAEGRGTSIDAAKAFRDSGVTAEDLKNQGLSLTGSVAKEGQALANLDPNIFNQVVSGEIKPARGAMLGQVAEHADQLQLQKLIQEREASGRPMTDSQVQELVRMQAPQVTETQHSLFGDDEVSRSLIAEKAGVSDYVQSRLTQKRRTFNAVGNERAATRLAEAGNVIDADKNAAIAEATNQEHAVYQKLSTVAGPVADALDEAAKALHAGENPAIVKVRTYAKIEPILKAEADKLTGRGKAPAERSDGPAQAGGAEAGRGQHHRAAEAADEDLAAPLMESIKRARNTSDLMK